MVGQIKIAPSFPVKNKCVERSYLEVDQHTITIKLTVKIRLFLRNTMRGDKNINKRFQIL